MKSRILAASAMSLCAAAAAFAQPVVMEWVTVGNAGNTADPTTGFGSVAYAYRIGTYEVTNARYAAFLNAIAASDPNGLYNENMGSDPRGGIVRSGSSGSFTYSVKANMGNKPVNFVSWYDAARMSNWMTNGQGSSDTESGVYTLTGPTSISAITRDLSNPNQVFIPSEDEWYKAAYHQPAAQGGDADDYWLYATRSNTAPTVATATSIGDVANPGQGVVNYLRGADWNGQDGNLTTVGSAESTGYHGAFDMNGNVLEWNETLIGSNNGVRGGAYSSNGELGLGSSFRVGIDPGVESSTLGFRLASPVPPCPADLTGSSDPNDPSFGQPDGDADGDDFFFYLEAFASVNLAVCDLTGSSDPNDPTYASPDGDCDGDDFFVYLDLFAAGCP
ncbi:MAG: GC-type dockerin domain-anchored protein [Phycisphaerales bacterium JB037]